MSPSITDVSGVLVGHAQDGAALTGCTVVLAPEGAVGAVDVRGGAPGTRETDLLAPVATVDMVHAVALCGGSAFGLAAATGVVQWLSEQGIGFPTGVRPVPIVPAAVIFDLAIGDADRFPDAAMGYAACSAAGASVSEGCVGAGIGATVGKIRGMQYAMKSGVGTWSERLVDGVVVGALAVCNAFGDVYDERSGRLLAGARADDGSLVDAMALLRGAGPALPWSAASEGQNTTLAVVATDARLTKAEATKVAQMAQDALARTIRPVHTPFDGDTVFVLATGRRASPGVLPLGAIAAEVLARAIERSVTQAWSLGGVPGMRRDAGGERREG
ncbi:P1 family peptidase [Roseiflexus sp.]|uniref:P1 family peptidase n=1 Tax=Roseiflexus sp. TaxID=2562120 RepID=UPI0021DBA950|nr:P1 family peptidase [Roseiflexus sp.]GIW03209.1 MAG: peptidase S58 [Roseiflexus sp.]